MSVCIAAYGLVTGSADASLMMITGEPEGCDALDGTAMATKVPSA